MSVEAILTVVTVVLAVLALIPQARAQDLRLRLGGPVAWAGGVAAALVLYWAFLEPIHALPGIRMLPRPVPWVGQWTSANLSLLTLLVMTGGAWWGYTRRLSVSRVPRLAVVIADALARRRHGECMHLLEVHLAALHRALTGDYWQTRLRLRVLPTPGERFVQARRQAAAELANARRDTSPRPPAAVTRPDIDSGLAALPAFRERSRPARWFSGRAERPRDAAQDIVRQMTLAAALIREIAAVNPYLGLRLMRLESSWMYREFTETFALALLADPESVLYRELRRAQNIDRDQMIVVDEREQPLLAALCADAVRPDGPAIVYTFLDLGIDPLRWRRPSELVHILNGPIADYHERGRWVSPPFVTLYLFRIIAPRVAVDPKASSLNLYGIRTLANAVLEQLEPSSEVEAGGEWATPSHYLLSDAVSLLSDLVRMLESHAEDLQRVRDAKADPSRKVTLPDHAIDVLGAVMYVCLRSERLDAQFKSYLLESWWRAYSDKYRGDWLRSRDILETLARGGEPGSGDRGHWQGIADALAHMDPVITHSPAADALRARVDLPTV